MSRNTSADENLDHLRRLARLLDSAIPLPGGYRIGLDGLIGLVPGIGDTVGAGAGAYIIIRAAQMGAPTSTLVRMIWNVILETLIGAIPVLGDVFDFVWKANNRNIALLEQQAHRLTNEPAAKRRLTTATLLLLGAFLLVLGLLIVGLFSLLVNLTRIWGAG